MGKTWISTGDDISSEEPLGRTKTQIRWKSDSPSGDVSSLPRAKTQIHLSDSPCESDSPEEESQRSEEQLPKTKTWISTGDDISSEEPLGRTKTQIRWKSDSPSGD